MSYDTTNLRLSVIERLRTNTHRMPSLDRDIDIVLGLGRRCNDGLRHRDNYVMPMHRDDFVLPYRWTASADMAMSLVPELHRAATLIDVVGEMGPRPDAWSALPSRIVRAAIIAHHEHGVPFAFVRPH